VKLFPPKMPIALAAAVALLCAFPLATGSVASGPTAKAAAKKCGNVKTRNGNRARYVSAVRVTCSIARKVAKRANGSRRFRALGFSCKARKSKGLPGRLYGCGRARAGKGQGVGFLYAASGAG